MTIYEAIKKDHLKVKQLLNQLVNEEQGIKNYKKLVGKIRDELVPHSRAEEAVFYNSIRDTNSNTKVLAHSYGEHVKAETLLRTLQSIEVFDAKGLAVAKKLKEALEHHITEEEENVFPVAKKLFLDQEAEDLGEAFEKMKPEIKEESIVGTTWDLIVNMMPQRLRKSFYNTRPSA